MGSQDVTHNPSFYFSIGAQVLITLVLLALVIVGIVIAVRAKTGTGKGCGIVIAVAFALQSCLAAFFFLISYFAGLQSSSSSQPRIIHAKDGSCEISVPKSWVESPYLSAEGVLAAKDLSGSEYVVIYAHSKQDYVGNLNDFAAHHTDLLREKVKTPQVEAPATISINGKPAVRQVVRGEIDHLRTTYRITYFEGTRLIAERVNSARANPHPDPWPAIYQRLGALNGLIAQANGDHRTLRYTDLAIREPRPTKLGAPAAPSS